MRAGVRPSEFWELTPVEYNLIVDVYAEKQKEALYRDIRNDYYTGCFAQAKDPKEFYDSILDKLDSKPQTEAEIFNFLKGIASRTGDAQADILNLHFNIPLKLTPEFDVGVFNYIYRMESDTQDLYLPDVALSVNGTLLTPNNGIYTIKPGLLRIKYNEQIYSIVVVRS